MLRAVDMFDDETSREAGTAPYLGISPDDVDQIAAGGVDTWAARVLLRAESYLRGLGPEGTDLESIALDRFDATLGAFGIAGVDPFELAAPPAFGAAAARRLAQVGSPIEGWLLDAILAAAPSLALATAPAICRIGSFILTPQRQAGPYRLDFALESHDFHERTKEQAAHDRRRDRAFQAAGWVVLRFTGAEIWRDADACALEVFEHLRRLERGGQC